MITSGTAVDSLRLPERAAISVMTLGELRAGVLLAADASTRAARQARFDQVRSVFSALPVDEAVADSFGPALATARSLRRSARASDLLIIATAAATGRTLHTRDGAQAGLAEAVGLLVVSSG